MRAANHGSQFVIATHSPILLGYPGARIYSFDRIPIAETDYESVEHVVVMRRFLEHRMSEIEQLTASEEKPR
jgi:predicted ATPase